MRRIMIASLWLLSSSVLFMGGCAFTDAKINVGYSEALASRGPLATVSPQAIEIAAVTDKRPETDKIGYKRNGFNRKTAKIETEKPVPEIIRDALALELKQNGHQIGGTPATLRLSADIMEFWLDINMGYWTIDFVGAASLAVKVINTKDETALMERTYRGYYKTTAMGGLEGTWEHVMNTALQEMMRDIGTDVALTEAFKKASTQ